MNIFYHKFTAGQVVLATGVPNPTLQSWMKRGFIVGARESGMEVMGGGTPGQHRMFSFHNVMEVAVAKTLIDAGLGDLDAAFQAAVRFAHFGHGPMGSQRPARMPSCIYDAAGLAARTLLFVRGDHSEEILWNVGVDVLPSLLSRHPGGVLVEIDTTFDRVVTVLGYNPGEVLSLAYSPRTDEIQHC